MRLIQVDPTVWIVPSLIEALQRVQSKTGARWPTDYVMSCITTGRAGLFRFMDGDKHLAWMVVERLQGFEVVLNVWILTGSPSVARRGAMITLIDDLARSVGASHWKLESTRKGWARMLRGYITETRVVYERNVNE